MCPAMRTGVADAAAHCGTAIARSALPASAGAPASWLTGRARHASAPSGMSSVKATQVFIERLMVSTT